MGRISYFFDEDIGCYTYGATHPMKPHRIRMTHELVKNYGLDRRLDCFSPLKIGPDELLRFHSDDFVYFLNKSSPEWHNSRTQDCYRFNCDSDSPVLTGLWDYCLSYTGSSLGCAARINSLQSDVAINWSGGLHHAKRGEASGFCYANDIVLATTELLKRQKRVLYIDIDVHHGDGVEEAFYLTDRVLTLSFHRYGDFFPGTGHLKDTGAFAGKGCSLNVPFEPGTKDDDYLNLFNPIISEVVNKFGPEAIILQCGTDSLAHDRLGGFNLTSSAHKECVRKVRETGLPLIVLGGGGYTVRNVARAWALETAELTGARTEKSDGTPFVIPPHEYYDYYAPDYLLEVKENTDLTNHNSKEGLEKVRQFVFEELKSLDSRTNEGFGEEVIGREYSELIEEWEKLANENDEYELVDQLIRKYSIMGEEQDVTSSRKIWQKALVDNEKTRRSDM